MKQIAMPGAHWPALVAPPRKDDRCSVEQRLERALAAAGAVAWEWDLATAECRLSAGTVELLTLKDDPADGFFALVHPTDRDWLRDAVVDAVDGKRPYDFEFRLLRPDGRVEWVRDSGQLEYGADGVPMRLAGVAQVSTAHKRVQDAFAATFEQAAVGMAHVAPDGSFFKVNDTLCRTLGRPREALMTLGFQDITHPDDLRADLAQVEMLLAGGITTYSMEKRYLLPGGGTVWANLTVSLVRDLDGAPDYFISVIEDISARRTTQALGQSLVRGLVDGRPNCIKVLDAAGRLMQVNDQGLRALEVEDFATICGLPFEALWPEAERDHVRRAVAEAGAGGTARFHACRPTVKGGPRWWAVAVWPLPGGDGRLLAVSHDVTDARRAELALAESQAMFRSLVDSMPQTAFIARPDGHNEFQNRRWFEYTGQVQSQSAGAGWTEALHPDDQQPTLAAWTQALANGAAHSIEHRLRGADGAYRWFLTRAEPLRGPGGEVLRWFGTCTEVSEIVAAREAAARSAAELASLVAERTRALSDAARELAAEIRRGEEAQAALQQSRKLEALGQLTGGVAHDFNNVLSAIIGSYALIRRRTKSPDILSIVGHGEQAAERATKLIRQLMAFARKEEMRPAALAPAVLLRGVEDLLSHAVGDHVRCVVDAPDGLWPVLADQHQLEIALLNLAVNARAAMPGSGTLTVAARNLGAGEHPAYLPAGGYVSISVCDTGMGMPPEVVAHATEPFFTTKARGEGTGLGLSMVHGFAEQSGGVMRIESQLGTGTLVEIILPRAALTDVAAGSGLDGTVLDGMPHGDAV
ncbi:MAG: PAS domain-containing protein, partial [Janthinobacterium lividum]